MHTSPLHTVVLAAGRGTRMKSSLPKVLHPILGRSLLGHVLHNAISLQCEQIVVVVGHEAQSVEDHVESLELQHAPISFALQAEQLGTGHAVLQAEPTLSSRSGSTLILSGDVPNLSTETLQAFLEQASTSSAPLAFMTCVLDDPKAYGRVVRDEDTQAPQRIVEFRDADADTRAIQEINAGIYLVDNAFLWTHLGQLGSNNAQNEYYLTDLIEVAAQHGGADAFIVSDPREVQGINTRLELAHATAFARESINTRLMLSGVTMLDPSSTHIDATVQVDPDVTLDASVRLTGSTHIHSHVTIQQGCVIENSVVESHSKLLPYSHLEDSRVRASCSIGPFAHLRPQSDIGPKAKVGNFVETKKTRLGLGSKASHLTYLGDAIVGEGCNIGAGTITCNYDGRSKHQTILHDGAFIGSNTALVAPISLGKDTYIGAGSTITQNVPDGALGVARGRQKNIEGWGTRQRRKSNKSSSS